MLRLSESEHEVFRETVGVALHGLVEPSGADAVDRCQVTVENDPVATQDENRAGDVRGSRQGFRAGHREYRLCPASTCRTSRGFKISVASQHASASAPGIKRHF